MSLGCGVRHALAVQQAQDGDGSREGTAGLCHATHARAESLENTKRGIGIKTQCRGKRAGDGLSAVESLFMVGGCLSLAGSRSSLVMSMAFMVTPFAGYFVRSTLYSHFGRRGMRFMVPHGGWSSASRCGIILCNLWVEQGKAGEYLFPIPHKQRSI